MIKKPWITNNKRRYQMKYKNAEVALKNKS